VVDKFQTTIYSGVLKIENLTLFVIYS